MDKYAQQHMDQALREMEDARQSIRKAVAILVPMREPRPGGLVADSELAWMAERACRAAIAELDSIID